MEKLIFAKELSTILGLSITTMNTQLANFGKYLIVKGGRYYYKYNYYFLRDLKKYYQKRAKSCNVVNSIKYYKIIQKLEELIKKT